MSRNSATLTFIIIGADGQVGHALAGYLSERDVSCVALSSADAYDAEHLDRFLNQHAHRSFVVNALFEEPERLGAELKARWMRACEHIAQACERNNQVLLQLSSGRVFSGYSPRGYHETDPADSPTETGQCYIDLESTARRLCQKTVLLRVDWLFSESTDNFLNRLVKAAIEKEELCISTSMRGCPTDAHTVARVLVAMAEQIDCGVTEPELWGVYHYADSDACSLHTFAKTVITVVKSMSEVRVETLGEVDTRPVIDGEKRAENHELNCRKILSTFGIKQRPWRRSLHDVLKHRLESNVG